jgi:hypothetical protein
MGEPQAPSLCFAFTLLQLHYYNTIAENLLSWLLANFCIADISRKDRSDFEGALKRDRKIN